MSFAEPVALAYAHRSGVIHGSGGAAVLHRLWLRQQSGMPIGRLLEVAPTMCVTAHLDTQTTAVVESL